MEWTREKTLALINEYRKRRGLWDMTHGDYRKKEMKQKLLAEVSASFGGGIPIGEIEKKFHTLRTQYHREINRMKRKEPYNSKWFGFKALQFLSSPKACRSGKGKIKSEISPEVVSKYIIRETAPHDNGESISGSNITEEFLTIHRKPVTITYESTPNSGGSNSNVHHKYESNRARDLEKLIEETTKDVDEPEDAKPKAPIIKEINIPIEHHTYSATALSTSETSDHHHQHEQLDTEEHNLETIDIQPTTEEEIAYQHHHATSSAITEVRHHQQHHQQPHQQQTQQQQHITNIHPTRVIKIQRRDTCNEDEYYEDGSSHQQQHQIHDKRIYYENGSSSSATVANASAGSNNILATLQPSNTLHSSTLKVQQQPQQPRLQQSTYRDEFSTYGEYVANEMREITNREVLIALKHKINTALFEANMAELQK